MIESMERGSFIPEQRPISGLRLSSTVLLPLSRKSEATECGLRRQCPSQIDEEARHLGSADPPRG
jgi:hypothetical protein